AEVMLIQPWPLHAAGQAEQPGAGRAWRPDPGESRTTDPQDLGHAQQRLHVIDRRRLAEQPGLRRERRLVPRVGTPALDRVEQRGLLAGYVGASPAPELELERESQAHHVRPEETARSGLVNGMQQARLGERVFAPDVQVAALSTARVTHDRDGFNKGV